MKTLAQVVAAVAVTTSFSLAAPNDVTITASRTKLEEEKNMADKVLTVTTRDVAYKVTVQNKTFSDMANLQIKYMIFYESENAGSKEGSMDSATTGSQTLALIPRSGTITFETKPVRLTTTDLDGGYYYTSGASNRSKDRIRGAWFRAYLNGEMVGEYANPSTISKNKTWKE